MLSFPSTAAVGRPMPKEAFYKRLTLISEVREKFVSDVKRIVLEYKLAADTLNVDQGGEVAEILVLSLELKKQELDYRIVENIARQNAHKLLFLLKFQDQGQLALYYGKLYKTPWQPLVDLTLSAKGLSITSIWEGFIEQIAFNNVECKMQNAELSIDERLKKQESILKLQKEIDKLERHSRNEKQPKKRFELFTRLQDLKKKLIQMEN
ncbi:conserved hypothetical protein [Desulforamulus reducens MI-1]|uniref:DUF4391 domain-containing protein n=1 Tax=Desulforamulus reducens (strain ATCC BAA-1160 / DSM 100696 / MI-1) TaxID=349161 RepID=A4J6R0_DESRM|nr:DUF4391 domain-containing protein [Desulforamulus reducens]ABO50763.1 conserved hypothetical protein [Desulforamulus reducens MI-1]